MAECFPKANYGGCVVGAQQNDRGTDQDLEDMKSMANSSCQELDVMLTRQGVNTNLLK